MNIGLHDADGVGFKYPNLALMKLSAYHKSIGNNVDWWTPLLTYDTIYSSKVFTFNDTNDYLPENVIKGGTGYGIYKDLPEEIDSIFPDYSLYPHIDYSIGFLTRGCTNKCSWCVVPKKEGNITGYRTWQEVKRIDSRDIVFMDNNVLASDWGLEQIQSLSFAKHEGKKVRVDFNQGLDARLVTPEIAKMLSKLQWLAPVRLACDTKSQMPFVGQAVAYMREAGVKPNNYFCYVLVKEIEDALERVIFLRNIKVDPFAQPYRDFINNTEPADILKDFARWVNHKATFKTVSWKDYLKDELRQTSADTD